MVSVTVYTDDHDHKRTHRLDIERKDYNYAVFPASNHHHPTAIYFVMATAPPEINPGKIFKLRLDENAIEIDITAELQDLN